MMSLSSAWIWPFALAAWGAAAFWVLCLVHTVLGALFVPRMPKVGAGDAVDAPKVSVIFAYRDEKDGILAACRSMLAQDHPALEVIAVNDRSSDGSDRAVDALASDLRLKRVTVDRLPSNWLGKNHALQAGADAASGEWLLFTDADVIFERDTVRRAVAMTRLHRADHLALLPRVVLDGPVERLFYRTFGSLFAVRFQPWASRFRKIYGFAGVGAFNMVRRSAYRRIGEHRAIAMEVADDLMLAKRVKDEGLRLFLGSGEDAVSVRWFVGLDGMMRSIHKNAFRGFNYRADLAALGALSLVICALAPILYLIVTGGGVQARAAAGMAAAAMVLLQFGFGANPARNLAIGLLMPAGLLLVAAAMVRSAWDALRDQAVTWRGTRYPLELLRRSPPL